MSERVPIVVYKCKTRLRPFATVLTPNPNPNLLIKSFHSRAQQLCKFIGMKGSANIRKQLNPQRFGW